MGNKSKLLWKSQKGLSIGGEPSFARFHWHRNSRLFNRKSGSTQLSNIWVRFTFIHSKYSFERIIFGLCIVLIIQFLFTEYSLMHFTCITTMDDHLVDHFLMISLFWCHFRNAVWFAHQHWKRYWSMNDLFLDFYLQFISFRLLIFFSFLVNCSYHNGPKPLSAALRESMAGDPGKFEIRCILNSYLK